MSDTDYAYAVARIRSKELTLLNAQIVEQLLAAKNSEECIRILEEKGWGGGETSPSAQSLLIQEREKTWSLIAELVEDMSVFDVFLYANDYHNLKAAIKLVYTDTELSGVFLSHGTIDPAVILETVKDRSYTALPEHMRSTAEEAFLALSHTGDGQLCDMIIDKAALDAIYAAGKASSYQLIKDYAELTVAATDIKVAVRCQKTGKSLDFIQKALAPCDSVDLDSLARAAAASIEAVLEYLSGTAYAEAAQALRVSASQFERWCDNVIIKKIQPQKYHSFTIEPLAAYLLARENEIKTVRMILSGKLNKLSDDSVRERLRELYV